MALCFYVATARYRHQLGNTGVPVIRNLFTRLRRRPDRSHPRNSSDDTFRGSNIYWEHRYQQNGNSGAGSYGKFADFKAQFINDFIERNNVVSVIDFGCGDGNQLSLLKDVRYVGVDVSATAVSLCRTRYQDDASKRFLLFEECGNERCELGLSLDVIYHIVEDQIYEQYMRQIFTGAKRFVIIYSSDQEENYSNTPLHIRHRKFTQWIEDNRPDWILKEQVPNRYPYSGDHLQGSWSQFFVYEKAEKLRR